VPQAVVGHVRVVDACRKGDVGRLKGVFGGQGDHDTELAAGVDCVFGAFESDVPSVQVCLVRQLDGHARWRVRGAFGKFLGEGQNGLGSRREHGEVRTFAMRL